MKALNVSRALKSSLSLFIHLFFMPAGAPQKIQSTYKELYYSPLHRVEGSCYQSVVGTQNGPVAIVTKEELYLCYISSLLTIPNTDDVRAGSRWTTDNIPPGLHYQPRSSGWPTLKRGLDQTTLGACQPTD